MRLVAWQPDDLLRRLDDVVAVYGEAMGYRKELLQTRRGYIGSHVRRPGFRAVATLTAEGRLAGFGYGYTSAAGQWWHDQVRSALDEPSRGYWLTSCFEVVELHVRPVAQGHGVGARQLRALLRAAVHGNVKVMLPMVSDVAEVRRTRTLIDECAAELDLDGTHYARFDLGVMIETPAAVLIAPDLAGEVAFFSIGTNDLTQYVMAADRLNPAVAALNDVANPAVMAAIAMTARAGVEAGIMVGMCGEAAGRPDLIPRFIEMGLTELSMSPASIPRAKKTIAGMCS